MRLFPSAKKEHESDDSEKGDGARDSDVIEASDRIKDDFGADFKSDIKASRQSGRFLLRKIQTEDNIEGTQNQESLVASRKMLGLATEELDVAEEGQE